jgi:hypothetical protein
MKDFDQKVPPLAIFIPSMVWSTQLPIGVRAGVTGGRSGLGGPGVD